MQPGSLTARRRARQRRTPGLRSPTVVAVLALGLATTTALEPPAASAQVGTLAFTSYRDGVARVYAVNGDGSGLRALTRTRGAAFEGSPAFSPDGGRIAYVCGNFELCVMDADGSAQARLTENEWPRDFRYDGSPSWSPDGSAIAFARTSGGRDGIWIVNADGSGARRLPVPEGANSNPVFSPDGSRIAFDHAPLATTPDSDVNATWDGAIYVIGVDGSGLRRLTRSATDAADPAWSPDGRSIAFSRDLLEDPSDVLVMNADGTGLRRLNQGTDPAWSPDGRRIALADDRGRGSLLFHVASGGGPRERLTGGRGADFDPVWQPLNPSTSADEPATPTAPPSTATTDARVVGVLLRAAAEFSAFLDSDLTSSGVLAAATRTETLARRIRTAVRPLRPSSRRGQRVRRLVLRSMRGADAVAGELRAWSRSVRRHDRRAARAHRRDSVLGFLGLALGLGQGAKVAGAPLGDP